MNKSEQLIACLEGEIAKRDEELAACRVAVENCEVFRARVAELESAAESLRFSRDYHHEQENEYRRRWAGIYAAPVSEAKAQGVVMQASNFEASNGEYRNPGYEGQFDGETVEQAEARRHWATTATELATARLNAAPAAPAADALVEALDYQSLFDAIAAATSVYANGAINISVQAFRDALAAHRAQGVE